MNRIVPITALIALSACGMRLPFATPPAPVAPVLSATERFVNAVEGQGCVLTTDNVGVILANATLDREALLQIVPQLEADGRAEVSGSGAIRVLTEQCI